MAREVARGEIWMYEFHGPDKLRPVLVLSRDEAIAVLHTVMVAPVTSTIRDIPSEVAIGEAEGLKRPSAINLDHLQTVEKTRLKRFVGSVGREKLRNVCRALAVAIDC